MSLQFSNPAIWPPQDDAIREALLAAYADGSWGKYHGPMGDTLRAKISQWLGVEHVYPCSSGTLAVELGLRGGRIGPGAEVILAGYDFPGNFRAIEAVGAKPVLVDLAPGTWTLDPAQIAAAASETTRAIIVSHLHGTLADMPRIMALAREFNLYVVEDACQVPGAMIAGKPAGSFGDCGILSFGGSKLLTAGRGGCIVTPHAEVLQRMKVFAERGNDAFPLSELQAAVLLPQLESLAARNEQRRQSVEHLHQALAIWEGEAPAEPQNRQSILQFASRQELPPPGATNPAYYKLGLWIANGNGRGSCEPAAEREKFLQLASPAGLPLDSGFRGFARRSNQRCRVVGDLPNSKLAADRTLLLHHPVLLESKAVLDQLAAVLLDVLRTLEYA